MLVDHSNTLAHGVTGSGEVNRFAIDQNFATVGVIQAEEHIHQSRFAGAVLAEETVNLSGFNDEVDGVICGEGSKAFGDTSEL